VSSSSDASGKIVSDPSVAADSVVSDASAQALPVPGVALEPAQEPAATKPKTGRFQNLLDLLHDLAIAVVVCVLLITYVVQAFKVQGTSMSPELRDGERILVNKFVYYFGEIERGDVVVFWYPEDPELSFIKRVVALPGETVEIRSGEVLINGRVIEEPYVLGSNEDHRDYAAHEVRSGHFFVLGDNRKGSNDSRSWGQVPKRYIYGKAFLRIWPLREVGVVR
jgi:signal peptidase I